MKYLVIAKPGAIPIPPDQGEQLLQASKDWIKAKLGDGSIDVTYNFFGGGGFAISNADSHETVLKELRETFICQKIIKNAKMLNETDLLEHALRENNELISIFVCSLNTVQRNQVDSK